MIPRQRNIFLTGFMGAGKSTVGRRLAQRLDYRFADLDQLIVAREGRSISEIFATRGEGYFRDCEAAVLAGQAETMRTVFATGGGIVAREENRAVMKRHGTVVYLRSSGRPSSGAWRGAAGARLAIRSWGGRRFTSCGTAVCRGTKKPTW